MNISTEEQLKIFDSVIHRKIKQFEKYKKNKVMMLKGRKGLPIVVVRKVFRPLLRSCLWIQRKIKGFSVEQLNDIKVLEKRPVIFTVTHIGKWDLEIVNEHIKEQSFLVAADFNHLYGTINGFFMNINGIIYVDEEDKKDKANTKSLMIKFLQSGKNIMIFPEGTWNLSENEILRDIAYGAAEAAISTDAIIVPIAVEQYDRHFVICYGNIIDPVKRKLDKQNLTIFLRNELASLKWQIWERKGICHRKTLENDYWKKFIRQRRAEWKEYSMREQIINTYIPKNKWEYW